MGRDVLVYIVYSFVSNGFNFQIFILSDLLLHWALIVPFVWTGVIVHGSFWYLDSLTSTFWPTWYPALIFAGSVKISQFCLYSSILFQSAMNKHQRACLVQILEKMAHAAYDRKTSMSLGFTELAISISAVCNMFITTAWIRSSTAFACGFLILVGLQLMSYVLHRAQKKSLNLLLLSYIKYQ